MSAADARAERERLAARALAAAARKREAAAAKKGEPEKRAARQKALAAKARERQRVAEGKTLASLEDPGRLTRATASHALRVASERDAGGCSAPRPPCSTCRTKPRPRGEPRASFAPRGGRAFFFLRGGALAASRRYPRVTKRKRLSLPVIAIFPRSFRARSRNKKSLLSAAPGARAAPLARSGVEPGEVHGRLGDPRNSNAAAAAPPSLVCRRKQRQTGLARERSSASPSTSASASAPPPPRSERADGGFARRRRRRRRSRRGKAPPPKTSSARTRRFRGPRKSRVRASPRTCARGTAHPPRPPRYRVIQNPQNPQNRGAGLEARA